MSLYGIAAWWSSLSWSDAALIVVSTLLAGYVGGSRR